MNAKARWLTRRAAAILNVPVPPGAERIWGTRPDSRPEYRGTTAKYNFEKGYAPSAAEMTCIRKLCLELSIPIPDNLITPPKPEPKRKQRIWP